MGEGPGCFGEVSIKGVRLVGIVRLGIFVCRDSVAADGDRPRFLPLRLAARGLRDCTADDTRRKERKSKRTEEQKCGQWEGRGRG